MLCRRTDLLCRCKDLHCIFWWGAVLSCLYLAEPRCCTWAFSSWGKLGLLFIVVCGLLSVVLSLVGEHGL